MATAAKAPGVTSRTYGQFCPIASGLDVIGDRWVLLILRELIIGDRRFTDLKAALPGIAPNLLSERLRSLESAGLVARAQLPPPAARTVYRLTSTGQGVVPVLRAVARFGVAFLDGEPSERFDARRVAHALLLPWWRHGDDSLRIRLVVGEDSVDLLTGDAISVEAPSGTPDVTLRTTVDELVAARRDGQPLNSAAITGRPAARRAALDQLALS